MSLFLGGGIGAMIGATMSGLDCINKIGTEQDYDKMKEEAQRFAHLYEKYEKALEEKKS